MRSRADLRDCGRVGHFLAVLSLLATLGLLASGCSGPNRIERLKFKRITMEQRAAKDRFFRADPDSPLLPEQRMNFPGLKYFAPDLACRVQARYTALPNPEELQVQTSSGQPRVYLKIGRIEFSLSDNPLTLFAYQEKAMLAEGFAASLFVPFTDGTSGVESYGGGRYLDLPIPQQDTIVLDFNRAYNPSCAYNGNYSCPVPPRENHLAVPIRAGEKTFKEI